MEYKTVLARTGEDALEAGYYGKERYIQYAIAHDHSRAAGRFCRHCSGKNVFVGFVLMLLLLLTGAVVQQQMEIHGLKQDVDLLSDKVSDLVIAQFLGHQQDIEAYKKGEQLFQNKANHQQDAGASTPNKRDAECDYHVRPSFFIHGADDVEPVDTFLWEYGDNSFDRNTDNFRTGREVTPAGFKIREMKIKHSGLYYIFVQLNAAGRTIRRHDYPAVGFSVIRRDTHGSEQNLGSAFVTQDGRGAEYMDLNNKYPVDSVHFSGLVRLTRDDSIWVQRLAHLLNQGSVSMFKHDSTMAHFGAFMVSSDCETL